ncbi:MAG: penicillin-binding protein 1C [Candidatus Riflebacteria bacterium]|nr:penicillin-binding protein 1C [Candidatus Riflebacteria bacterium]
MRARRWILVAAAGGSLIVLAVGLVLSPWPALLAVLLGPDPARLERPLDPVVVDRNGHTLLHRVGAAGTRGEWVDLDRCPARLVQAFLAAEDSRFRQHPGFDPCAIARAFWDNLTHRRIVSGASTLTQQTVRLLEPRSRTYWAKLVELVKAVALEKRLTKDQVLEQYLNRVPMPGALRGVAAGARSLFDRSPGELTLSECALLAAVPQAPGRLDPRRGGRALMGLQRRRRWVLGRMAKLGFIGPRELEQAVADTPRLRTGTFPFLAPHLVGRLARAADATGAKIVRTTLDARVQRTAEAIVRSHRTRLVAKACRQAACVVVDNARSEVLAWVGSLEWAPTALGFNDGVLARRSAGSTLKPFIYALALEGGTTLSTALADVRRTFTTPRGDYDPQNFDRRHFGPVLVRAALAGSLNTAAVEVARRVGVTPIGEILKQLNLVEPSVSPDSMGVGIAIGNVEVTLLDLAAAYATLATGGAHRPLTVCPDRERPAATRLIAGDVAWLITDVLSDPAARQITFGHQRSFDYAYPVAVKTGTSTGYRDCWAVGYTRRHTVAVWAGNFDGTSTALSGALAAAPILKDLLDALEGSQPPLAFSRPKGIVDRLVCSDSGDLPDEACPQRLVERFLTRRPLPARCSWHRPGEAASTYVGPTYAAWLADRQARGLAGRYKLDRPGSAGLGSGGLEIAYPHPGDRFILSRDPGATAAITVRAVPRRTVSLVRWFLDGQEVVTTATPYSWSFKLTRGHHTLLATTNDLVESATVQFQVE